MKTLCAGPWTGEFGWEIMTWQGHLRALVAREGYEKVIVCSEGGHAPLYGDFVDFYVPYSSTTEKANMWLNLPHREKAEEYFENYVEQNCLVSDDDYIFWLSPDMLWASFKDSPKWEQLICVQPQNYIHFGQADPTARVDIVYHARQRSDWDSGFRNWNIDHAEKLFSMFPPRTRIAAIGTKEHAAWVPGTMDLRGIRMEVLFKLLHNSKVLVGPISGPIHLGALCGIPEVIWATKQEHKDRVERTWNPFKTLVKTICSDDEIWKNRIPWTPPQDIIFEKINEVLNAE